MKFLFLAILFTGLNAFAAEEVQLDDLADYEPPSPEQFRADMDAIRGNTRAPASVNEHAKASDDSQKSETQEQ